MATLSEPFRSPSYRSEVRLGWLGMSLFTAGVLLVMLGVFLAAYEQRVSAIEAARLRPGVILDVSVPPVQEVEISTGLWLTPDQPRTAGVTALRVGPADGYTVLALLPAGADVDVLGRDAGAAWLALRVADSDFYGWAPAAAIDEAGPVTDLPVLPVRLLSR